MTTPNALSDPNIKPVSNTSNFQLKVIKRDGTLDSYNSDKIAVAITKAILAAEDHDHADASHVKQLADQIVSGIHGRFEKQYPSGGSINIEDIQDQVELGLMRQGMQKVARAYVLYREEHAQQRKDQQPSEEAHPRFKMQRNDGSEA
ncbi:ATP cone domain-containing protein, partial [Oleiphilus sp. HI0125]